MNLRESIWRVGVKVEPGFILVGRVKQEVCAVLELYRHRGGSWLHNIERCNFKEPATQQWLAWYSGHITANGWQPYDQPLDEAYMPLSYERFDSKSLEHTHGTLLRGKEELTAFRANLLGSHVAIANSTEEELQKSLGRVLVNAGVCPADEESAVHFLLNLTPR